MATKVEANKESREGLWHRVCRRVQGCLNPKTPKPYRTACFIPQRPTCLRPRRTAERSNSQAGQEENQHANTQQLHRQASNNDDGNGTRHVAKLKMSTAQATNSMLQRGNLGGALLRATNQAKTVGPDVSTGSQQRLIIFSSKGQQAKPQQPSTIERRRCTAARRSGTATNVQQSVPLLQTLF